MGVSNDCVDSSVSENEAREKSVGQVKRHSKGWKKLCQRSERGLLEYRIIKELKKLKIKNGNNLIKTVV